MFNILQTEIQKLKGSKMLWMILVGAGVPSFLDLMIAFHARGSGMKVDFPMLFGNAQMLLLLMMGPALFALFSGFLIAREHQDRTMNQLFIYPYRRIHFFLAKLIIMFPIIVVTFAFTFLILWVSGQLFFQLPNDWTIIGTFATGFGWGALTQWALVPLAMAVSMVGKTYIPSMVLGVAAVVGSGVIINSKYIMLYPYTAPVQLVMHATGKAITAASTTQGIATMTITFIAGLLFCLVYYARMDVNTD